MFVNSQILLKGRGDGPNFLKKLDSMLNTVLGVIQNDAGHFKRNSGMKYLKNINRGKYLREVNHRKK